MSSILFSHLNHTIDSKQLQVQLERLLLCEWQQHVNSGSYEGGWDVLPLRCPRQHINAHPILQSFAIEGESEWSNLPLLDEWQALSGLLEDLECPVHAVRLMRLKVGARIKPHRDDGLAMEFGKARLHIPLSGNDGVRFKVGGRTVPMHTGELWYINADMEHEVCNSGSADRINIAIDCEVNDWLKTLITEAGIIAREKDRV